MSNSLFNIPTNLLESASTVLLREASWRVSIKTKNGRKMIVVGAANAAAAKKAAQSNKISGTVESATRLEEDFDGYVLELARMNDEEFEEHLNESTITEGLGQKLSLRFTSGKRRQALDQKLDSKKGLTDAQKGFATQQVQSTAKKIPGVIARKEALSADMAKHETDKKKLQNAFTRARNKVKKDGLADGKSPAEISLGLSAVEKRPPYVPAPKGKNKDDFHTRRLKHNAEVTHTQSHLNHTTDYQKHLEGKLSKYSSQEKNLGAHSERLQKIRDRVPSSSKVGKPTLGSGMSKEERLKKLGRQVKIKEDVSVLLSVIKDEILREYITEESIQTLSQGLIYECDTEGASALLNDFLTEGIRKIHTEHGVNGKHCTVHRDSEWNEYVVKHHTNGVHSKKADYHTNDKDDAINTAKHWASDSKLR